MAKQKKAAAMVVEAIRSLRSHKGFTPREILHYIADHYSINKNTARCVLTALKRGEEYGLLRAQRGRYALKVAATRPLLAVPSDSDKAGKCVRCALSKEDCGCGFKKKGRRPRRSSSRRFGHKRRRSHSKRRSRSWRKKGCLPAPGEKRGRRRRTRSRSRRRKSRCAHKRRRSHRRRSHRRKSRCGHKRRMRRSRRRKSKCGHKRRRTHSRRRSRSRRRGKCRC